MQLLTISRSFERTCEHLLSQRYVAEFPATCELPKSDNSSYSIQSLSHLILPAKITSTPKRCAPSRLRSLDVSGLTPSFFAAERLPMIKEVFKDLKEIKLLFLADAPQIDDIHGHEEFWYRGVKDGQLKEALTVATKLEHLQINFSGLAPYDEEPQMESILGDNIWQELSYIDLDCMRTDAEYLVEALDRQPYLAKLFIANMTLTEGSWVDVLIDLRQDLILDVFFPCGVLEDPHETHITSFIDIEAFFDGRPERTLGEAMDEFVTDREPYHEDDWHPLTHDTWGDEDELMDGLEYSDG